MSEMTGRAEIDERIAEIELTHAEAVVRPLISSAAHPGDSTLSNAAYNAIRHDIPWLLSQLREARKQNGRLRRSLAWTLSEMGGSPDECPDHFCEFTYHPDRGGCDFHEEWVEANDALGRYAATPAPGGTDHE